ncbi:MAG: carboxypeptidase regulatory-like domain-containing protein [Kofleriaceae bacterium]
MRAPRSLSFATLAVAAAAATASAAPATGTIAGAVAWKGAAPTPPPLDRSSDPVCAKDPRTAEDVVVTNGKLRDVLVRITVGGAPMPPPGPAEPPPAPAVVLQSQCMYGPRVVGIVPGQAVEIRNLDATFHNVRGNLAAQVLWNLAQPKGAPAITRTALGKPGDIVSLHCDVHPWMAAWVAVTDHPYFAVTGADGAFTLKGVPPGSYTVEAWHPTLGKQTVKVKVKKGKTAKATFTFAAPSAKP